MREDLMGEGRATQDVEDLIVRMAGRNPFGEPNYRVVLAQNRITKQAAEWRDWDEASSVQDRGGFVEDELGNSVESPLSPIRVVKEMRTIARYPICDCDGFEAGDCEVCGGVRGWIIEKWVPAHVIAGSEQEWYREKVPGTDLPRLGPYPERGEYNRVPNSRATKSVPSPRQLEDLLTFLEYRKANASGTKEQYVRERVLAMEAEEEKRRLKAKELARQRIADELSPLRGSSLAAGRLREEYARRLRERGVRVGHVGN